MIIFLGIASKPRAFSKSRLEYPEQRSLAGGTGLCPHMIDRKDRIPLLVIVLISCAFVRTEPPLHPSLHNFSVFHYPVQPILSGRHKKTGISPQWRAPAHSFNALALLFTTNPLVSSWDYIQERNSFSN